MNQQDLQNKTEEELRNMAKNIPGIAQSEMSKDELIDAIMKNQQSGGNQNDWGQGNPSEPGHGGGRGDTPPKTSDPNDWKNEPGNQS